MLVYHIKSKILRLFSQLLGVILSHPIEVLARVSIIDLKCEQGSFYFYLLRVLLGTFKPK